MNHHLTLALTSVTAAFLAGGGANSAPIAIYGNPHGIWSPTHPHLTYGRSTPHIPVVLPPVVQAPVASIPSAAQPLPAVAPVRTSYAPQAPDICITALEKPPFC